MRCGSVIAVTTETETDGVTSVGSILKYFSCLISKTSSKWPDVLCGVHVRQSSVSSCACGVVLRRAVLYTKCSVLRAAKSVCLSTVYCVFGLLSVCLAF